MNIFLEAKFTWGFTFALFLVAYVCEVIGLPQINNRGYNTDTFGYSSRDWKNLYKHGSPSKKIGGLKPFAQFGSASFYLQSSFGPGYVIGKVDKKLLSCLRYIIPNL